MHTSISGKPGPLMNERYPDIHPIGVRDYLSATARDVR